MLGKIEKLIEDIIDVIIESIEKMTTQILEDIDPKVVRDLIRKEMDANSIYIVMIGMIVYKNGDGVDLDKGDRDWLVFATGHMGRTIYEYKEDKKK